MRAPHPHPHARQARRGAVVVEAALTISLFLVLVFGAIDLGQAVFRAQMLSHASRHLARMAIVHGRFLPGDAGGRRLSTWGPATYEAPASSGDEIATAVRPMILNIDPARVSVRVEWFDVDGDGFANGIEDQVRVTLTAGWSPLFAPILPVSAQTLSATSEMPIAH